MGRPIGAVVFFFTLAAAACPKESELTRRQDTELPKARDGNIAIQQELDAAHRAGTVEAYDLFIARHPAHPLAQVARQERAAIEARRPRR
jgi:hypothetical protein